MRGHPVIKLSYDQDQDTFRCAVLAPGPGRSQHRQNSVHRLAKVLSCAAPPADAPPPADDVLCRPMTSASAIADRQRSNDVHARDTAGRA